MTSLRSYELSLYSDLLADVIAKAVAAMKDANGGATKFARDLRNSVSTGNFINNHQISKPGDSRTFTLGELCETKANEEVHQDIDPTAVARVLFGTDGLIKKTGGGRFPYLMEDIEVAYVFDPFTGSSEGPWITSGRNRTMALQIMLHAAGMPPEGIAALPVRVGVVQCRNRGEVQRRIISANKGSRKPSRAEERERMGSTNGVQFYSCDSILESIQYATNQDSFKAAFGGFIRHAAENANLNGLTPVQYSDAGNSLWNNLKTAFPKGGEFKTFYAWIKADSQRFVVCAKAAQAALPAAINMVAADRATGPKSTKLAKALAPLVIAAAGF